MLSIDVFTCYVLAGAGSLVGFGLISLVRTDQPRTRQALLLYRFAFLCLAGFLSVAFTRSEAERAETMRAMIGVAAIGASTLAWGFRQLNGQRTWLPVGLLLTLGQGAMLWVAGAMASDEVFAVCVSASFCFIAAGTLIDQGLHIVKGAIWRGGELSLLFVAALFSLDWALILWHSLGWRGPLPAHLLFAPDWLLAPSALGIAMLPLTVATVVFAIVNDRLNHQLRERALSDDLTGVLSRRGLRERGERMLAGQAQNPDGVAVLMLDVDHFKAINDRHGHLVGDEVLRHLTAVLRVHLRDDALFARYGGEEFTILLPVRHQTDGQAVAERLRQVIEAQPCLSAAGPIPITISIGVAFHRAAHSLEEVLSRADAHLYEAKQSGRNRVICEHLAV